MTIKPIYIYTGEGGTIQTTIKLPILETRQMRRLIADEGKELVKGAIHTNCIDVEIDEVDAWIEQDKKQDDELIFDKI